MLGLKRVLILMGLLGIMASADPLPPSFTVISVITEEYPPHSFVNAQGQIEGGNVEKVRKAFNKLNLNLEMQVMPWARGYEITKYGENLFLFTCSRTEERENDFKWVAVLSTSDVSVFALKSREIAITQVEDMQKFHIGGVIGYRYLPYFYKNGFSSPPGGLLELTTSDEFNLKKLFANRIDLMISNSDQIKFVAEKLKLDYSQIEKVFEIQSLRTTDYLVTGKKTPDEIIEFVRKGFE